MERDGRGLRGDGTAAAFWIGVIARIAGLAGMAANYPIYRKCWKKESRRKAVNSI